MCVRGLGQLQLSVLSFRCQALVKNEEGRREGVSDHENCEIDGLRKNTRMFYFACSKHHTFFASLCWPNL